MGRITRGALVGLLFALTAGIWPAYAAPSNMKVTSPANNSVLAGSYAADGSTSGFQINLRGTASTPCSSFSSITFKVTGPNGYSKSFPYGSYSGKTFSGGPSTPWDTQDLPNGLYSVYIYATDTGTLCNSQTGSAYASIKLANPPRAPVWNGSPTAASDGSANVTLSWNKNIEPDVVEYHILRTNPDQTTSKAVVPASGQGCSVSSGSITCTDTSFGSSYTGTYTYAIAALRSRPAYNTGETVKNCDTTNNPCVASGLNDSRDVSLTAPTPTPSPTDSPSPGGSGSPTPGGSGSPTPGGTGAGKGSSSKGTSVLSFGTSRSSSSYNQFYTGTYSESLPYQPKTLIVGGGTATPEGQQVEAGSVTNTPPNFRPIMLPVAGGLLAFLSAAHVRRLLIHF